MQTFQSPVDPAKVPSAWLIQPKGCEPNTFPSSTMFGLNACQHYLILTNSSTVVTEVTRLHTLFAREVSFVSTVRSKQSRSHFPDFSLTCTVVWIDAQLAKLWTPDSDWERSKPTCPYSSYAQKLNSLDWNNPRFKVGHSPQLFRSVEFYPRASLDFVSSTTLKVAFFTFTLWHPLL